MVHLAISGWSGTRAGATTACISGYHGGFTQKFTQETYSTLKLTTPTKYIVHITITHNRAQQVCKVTCGKGGGRWGTAATWDPPWWETDWNEKSMINDWAENLWAYPDSIDNSDRSASQGRNSFHYMDSTTARGPSNGHVRALKFAWWNWWNYSLTL